MTDDTYHPGARYALPRNQSEFDRLNVQHKYLTKVICDGGLLCDKSIKLGENCCVLDSGTGTGIWAIDLANVVPKTAEIHACDVSDANLTPNFPPQIHFSIASVTSLPLEWSNKFDLVNQRFLSGALLAPEWQKALAEIYRVLKPGGAVQIMELDPRHVVPDTKVATQVCAAMSKACDMLGLQIDVTEHVSELLREAGFADIVHETKRAPVGKTWGEIGVQGTLSFAGAFRNLSGIMVKVGLFSSEEEYLRLADKLPEEWDTHGSHFLCTIATARKPV